LTMSDRKTVYSGDYIRRLGELRTDSEALTKAYDDPDSRFLPVWQDRCLVAGDEPALLSRDALAVQAIESDRAIFLGRLDERFLFAVSLPDTQSPAQPSGTEYLGLRELTSRLTESEAALLAYAKAMTTWHRHHRYCGICGSENLSLEGGFVMACGNRECGQRSFPRLDPAIIVLVHQGSRCLLGRQTRWAEGQFSTIAGFVEPGESLEDAVRREVLEETNIRVGRCEYLASQPWPFPSALMIGYHAVATSSDIRLNDGELAEARWLTREDIAAGAVTLPPEFSVARRLIEAWISAETGTQ
jgi:NAD+ diphosphatase